MQLSIRLLLQHLGHTNITFDLQKENCSVYNIERGFAQYLSQERGLSPATLENYIPMVQHFLNDRFNAGAIEIHKLNPSDVTAFLLRYARTVKRKTAKLMVTALRAFFRYLRSRGAIDIDLAEFIWLSSYQA